MADNDTPEPTPTVAELLATIEHMEVGMKSMINAIVDLEKRVRALELRDRREAREKSRHVLLN